MLVIKGKTALGTGPKVIGKIEIFRGGQKTLPAFTDLKNSLKDKILVCPEPLSKSVLEKACALDVSGIVCQSVDEEEIERLKRELATSWSPTNFGFLVADEELKEILDKIEGKMGTLDVEKKKLMIDES